MPIPTSFTTCCYVCRHSIIPFAHVSMRDIEVKQSTNLTSRSSTILVLFPMPLSFWYLTHRWIHARRHEDSPLEQFACPVSYVSARTTQRAHVSTRYDGSCAMHILQTDHALFHLWPRLHEDAKLWWSGATQTRESDLKGPADMYGV